MRRFVWLGFLLCSLILVIQCGGPKQLTQDEYEQLSPQERVTYLEKYVKSNSTDISAKKQLYREYLEMGMTDRALAVMESIITQDPFQADVQFEYGEILIKSDKEL